MTGGMVCLPSSDPLLCAPSDKAQLETKNTYRQLLYVVELVALGVTEIRESHVLGFQRIAVDGIFPCAGQYRSLTRTAALEGGAVTHVPPAPAAIPGYVHDALQVINGILAQSRMVSWDERASFALRAAAYALWRFNWIHPFAGGNGRTARAIAYLILCIDYGGPLPGNPQMPTLIAGSRKQYPAALRAAAAAAAKGGEDLYPMIELVSQTVVQQLQSAVQTAKRARHELTPAEQQKKKRQRKAGRAARHQNRGR